MLGVSSRSRYSAGDVLCYRPLIAIRVVGPTGLSRFHEATLDSGADDTLLPSSVAHDLGIDLSNAPRHEAIAVGGQKVLYRFATLRERRVED